MQALSPKTAAQLRHMVETQIAPVGVRAPALCAALQQVPRAGFLPDRLQALGTMDEHVRLGEDANGAPRFLLRAAALAVMMELLAPQPQERGLDIGCNCGYSTALLSLLGESAIGVEEDAALAELAAQKLEQCEAETAAIIAAPHASGHAKSAPYDYVLVNGTCRPLHEDMPIFASQLRVGGRLICGQILRGRACVALYRRAAAKGAQPRFVLAAERDMPLPPLPAFGGGKPAEAAGEQSFAKTRGFA